MKEEWMEKHCLAKLYKLLCGEQPGLGSRRVRGVVRGEKELFSLPVVSVNGDRKKEGLY